MIGRSNFMDSQYQVKNTSRIFTPALLFYKDLIRRNIARAIEIARRPERLRPHVKTHKTPEIVRMEMDAGITKHKCATLAEAEMLAASGAEEVFIAYNMVGPNCLRLARLMKAHSRCRFAVTADNESALRFLSGVMAEHRQEVEVLLDLDVGQHRTGVAPNQDAITLYALCARLEGLRPGGLHVYDGHQHQEKLWDRRAAVEKEMAPVHRLRAQLLEHGLPVPRVIAGGTPTFPIYAQMDIPGLECAPGTCFLHDHGYGSRYLDIVGFTPAALLLTRVISRPAPNRITMDLGYKAVASDPPAGKRCLLIDVPGAEAVLHNEEHLVVETPAAERFSPGDEIYAIPAHICPTVAMHEVAHVVENGEVTEQWHITARNRFLNY
jgi:D-serine deaminase-like pyridoxal phosphate-dependent protein